MLLNERDRNRAANSIARLQSSPGNQLLDAAAQPLLQRAQLLLALGAPVDGHRLLASPPTGPMLHT